MLHTGVGALLARAAAHHEEPGGRGGKEVRQCDTCIDWTGLRMVA